MSTLPLAGDLLKAYNNLPGIPKDDPLGDLINQLVAGCPEPDRKALTGTEIDFDADFILFKTLTQNEVLTIVNPVLDKVILLEVTGVFTLTLPGSVAVFGGGVYDGNVSNVLYLHCNNAVAPTFVAFFSQM
jgi:hypothetical protein